MGYFLKRLLLFLPMLWIVSVVVFLLSSATPSDPALVLLRLQGEVGERDMVDDQQYEAMRRSLRLHLPLFYMGLGNAAMPDTLHRLSRADERAAVERLAHRYGNWSAVQNYRQEVVRLRQQVDAARRAGQFSAAEAVAWQLVGESLSGASTPFAVGVGLDALAGLPPSFDAQRHRLATAWFFLEKHPQRWRVYVPRLYWYGKENQYHYWFKALLRLEFGNSYQTQRPVSALLGERIGWTLLLGGLSLLLSYGISIPLGVAMAVRGGSWFDKAASSGLFVLYSLPSFWVAALLIMFLTQPQWWQWFPSHGVGNVSPEAHWVERLTTHARHLVLPLFCWTYPSLAFLTRQMRNAMRRELQADYLRTARAKGLTEHAVVWRHAFPNALLPMLATFANILPNLVAGSVAIEFIFSIPGLGKTAYDAIMAKDYPMVFATVLLTTALTMTGQLFSDIASAVADPRVRFGKRAN